jgi:NADH dehydrogenase
MKPRHSVVVLGAGYAGLLFAKRLANQVDPNSVDITIVNATDHFVERPRLHQVATSQRITDLPLSKLLGSAAVRRDISWCDRLDLTAHRVHLTGADGPRWLRYDTLVLANGSVVDTTAVPGITAHAAVLNAKDAPRLARRLATLDRGEVVVCGGGMTGIEAATEIAETHPNLTVTLLSRGEPGGWLSVPACRHLRQAFTRLGIRVTSGAEITAIEATHVELADGRQIAFDECLWAGGFSAPSLAAEAGMAVNHEGRPVVDETLRSVSHPDVFVAGDAAAAAGNWGPQLNYGCRVAGFMGPYLADALATRLAGGTAAPFTFRYIHQCISLGRRDAVVQFVNPADESPRRFVLTGRLAVWYKDLVLRSATWLFRTPGPYLRFRRVGRNAKVAAQN